MQLLDAIHTRRSIRKYQDKSVPAEMIKTIIRAGMAAPSAGNQQPWHFVVITDRAT
ncbi:MAG: nitroreductase family protein, partial [Deltaproteobacteria bacterium]|nr:nitroreductase family protein [Deltaproteobacteria bacterium]